MADIDLMFFVFISDSSDQPKQSLDDEVLSPLMSCCALLILLSSTNRYQATVDVIYSYSYQWWWWNSTLRNYSLSSLGLYGARLDLCKHQVNQGISAWNRYQYRVRKDYTNCRVMDEYRAAFLNLSWFLSVNGDQTRMHKLIPCSSCIQNTTATG